MNTKFPEIIINLVIMRENMSEIPSFVDLANELGVKKVQMRLMVPLNENYQVVNELFEFDYFEQKVNPTLGEFKKLIKEASKKAKEYSIEFITDNPVITELTNKDIMIERKIEKGSKISIELYGDNLEKQRIFNKRELRCKHPWENVLIDLNGNVRLCCHSNQVLGNLNYFGFEEIWNGDVIRKIRRRFLNGKLPEGCLNCPII